MPLTVAHSSRLPDDLHQHPHCHFGHGCLEPGSLGSRMLPVAVCSAFLCCPEVCTTWPHQSPRLCVHLLFDSVVCTVQVQQYPRDSRVRQYTIDGSTGHYRD